MLHALGYWRPTLAAFPDAPAVNEHATDAGAAARAIRAQYDKLVAESRRLTADYTRDYATYDAEAIAAVDKFRADNNLELSGQPAGPRRRAVHRRAA